MNLLKTRKFEKIKFEKTNSKKKQLSKKATQQRCFFYGYFLVANFYSYFLIHQLT